MGLSSFQEYLTSKGKVQDKAKVDASGDTGPEPAKKPEKPATSGKNWQGEPLAGTPANYTPATQPCKAANSEKGLADKGDQKLVYEPKGKEQTKKTFPKNENVRSLNLVEFAKYVQVADLPPVSPNPILAGRYVAALINANDNFLETVVREIKNLGSLSRLNAEVSRQLEVTDAPASDTEDEIPAKKARKPKTVKNQPTDGKGVVQTR